MAHTVWKSRLLPDVAVSDSVAMLDPAGVYFTLVSDLPRSV